MNPQDTNKTGLPFQYVVTTNALAAAGQQTVALTLEQDSWFKLVAYLGMGSGDNATDSEPNGFTVQIQESGGKLYQSAAMPQRLICPRQKMMPLVPVIIAPGTNLQFSFVNLLGVANTITFVLDGFKMFS